MTKRSIDSNWKKLLKSGEVTHKKKKKPKADYIKKTKDGKKTIWFDVDQVYESYNMIYRISGLVRLSVIVLTQDICI